MLRFGLFGADIGYSLSPAIHNAIYRIEGKSCEYRIYDYAESAFEEGLRRVSQLDGFNVTKPYKQKILPFIGSVSCNAVNTVVCKNGVLEQGFQTDGGGFSYATKEIDFSGREVLLLGAGGAAHSIAQVIKERNGRLVVFNRTAVKAEELARQYGGEVFNGGSPHIIISAVSVANSLVLPKSVMLDRCSFVFDAVYRQTPLLKLAESMRIPHMDGRVMLVYQAILSEQAWCGVNPSTSLVKELLRVI